jgi:hypothetical protein
MNKGEIALQLGKFIAVDASSDDIQKGIKTMAFPGPNEAILKAMQYLDGRAQRLSTVTDVVSGQVDKVLQPTTVMELSEQSAQLFTSIEEFQLESWNDELQKLYRLNKKHLDKAQYFAINTLSGLEEVEIAPDDFGEDLRVVPIADPRLASERQKQAKATFLWQFVTTNPLTAQNPLSLYNASKRVLKTMEIEDIDEILPPLVPQEVERFDDQDTENMFFMMAPENRPMFDVFPDQDHIAHLESMAQFEANPYFQAVDKKAWMEHRNKHLAYAFGNDAGIFNEAGPQGGGPGQPDGMGAPPGDAGGAAGDFGAPAMQPGGMAQDGLMGGGMQAAGPSGRAGGAD